MKRRVLDAGKSTIQSRIPVQSLVLVLLEAPPFDSKCVIRLIISVLSPTVTHGLSAGHFAGGASQTQILLR
jgi:hypothetical protein